MVTGFSSMRVINGLNEYNLVSGRGPEAREMGLKRKWEIRTQRWYTSGLVPALKTFQSLASQSCGGRGE